MHSIYHQNCPPSHVIVCRIHHHGYPTAALCPLSLYSLIICFLLQIFEWLFSFFVCAIVFVYFSISTSTLVWLLGKQLNIYRSTVERPRVHEHCRLKIIHTMRTTSEREREKRKNRREHSDRGARISLFFFCSFSHFLFHRRSLVFSHWPPPSSQWNSNRFYENNNSSL